MPMALACIWDDKARPSFKLVKIVKSQSEFSTEDYMKAAGGDVRMADQNPQSARKTTLGRKLVGDFLPAAIAAPHRK